MYDPQAQNPAPPSEEEGPAPQPPQTPEPVQAPEPSQPLSPPQNRGSGWTGKAALALSAVAVLLAAVTLVVVLQGRNEPEPPPEEPGPQGNTFQYRDRIMTALEGVPVNAYAKGDFSLNDKGRVAYPGARAGIDVSTHQQEIDWPAVAADGVDYAILRVGYRGYTEGGLFADSQFARNIQGATGAGLDVGLYFFSQAITPAEAEMEAAFVLEAIGDYEIAGPVAFDWERVEDSAARTNGLDGETLTRCAVAFCEKIKAAGYEPAVYLNQDQAYLRYDLRQLTDYTLWLAEYGQLPNFYYDFDLWQYSCTGTVAGIQGDVDLNLDLRGAKEEGETPE